MSFSTTRLTLPGVSRRYRSFSEAAVENGISRVYCGIPFVRAVVDGYKGGQELGRRVTRALEPLR